MINSTSKVAHTYKKGDKVLLSEVEAFRHNGLPWFETTVSDSGDSTTHVRITIDTDIEITVKQVLGYGRAV